MFRKFIKQLKLLVISVEMFDKQVNQYKTISKEPALPSYAYINWGLFLIKNGKSKKGIEKFEQSMLMNQSNPESYLNLGVTFAQSGMFNEALKNFRKAVKLNPNSAKAWSFLASAYSELNEVDLASSAFEKAVALDRTNALISLNYGIFCMKNSKTEMAKSLYKKAYLLDSTLIQALFMWGVVLVQENDYKNAKNKFLRLLEQDPFNSEALYLCGLCSLKLKNFADCIEYCKKSASINSQKTDNYVLISEAYYNNNEKDKALEIFEKTKEFAKNDWKFFNGWALTLQNLEKFEESIEKFKKAIELNPDEESVNNAITYSLIKLEKYDEAKEYIEKVLNINPKLASGYFNLGQILLKQNEYLPAIVNFKKAIALDSSIIKSYSKMAAAYNAMKDKENAVKFWLKAIEYDKNDKYSFMNLAMNCLENKENPENTKKALRYIRSAYEIDKNDSEVNFKYGVVLMHTNDLYRAIEKLEESYKLNENNLNSQMAIAECYFKLKKADKTEEILNKFKEQKSEDKDYMIIELMLLNHKYINNENNLEIKDEIIKICDKILTKFGFDNQVQEIKNKYINC